MTDEERLVKLRKRDAYGLDTWTDGDREFLLSELDRVKVQSEASAQQTADCQEAYSEEKAEWTAQLDGVTAELKAERLRINAIADLLAPFVAPDVLVVDGARQVAEQLDRALADVKRLREALTELVERRERVAGTHIAVGLVPPQALDGSDGRYARARAALAATDPAGPKPEGT